jgi:hypothetical protein
MKIKIRNKEIIVDAENDIDSNILTEFVHKLAKERNESEKENGKY